MPDPAHPDHLARLRVDRRIPVSLTARRHRQTIGLRHTDRRPAVSAPIDAGALDIIVAAAGAGGAELRLLRPEELHDLAAATEQSGRSGTTDLAWRAELTRWTGGVRPLGDGLSGSVTGYRGPDNDADRPIVGPHGSAAVFAILHGPGDGEVDWLRAGEALSAVWLRATELGMSVLPLSAAIEVADTRDRIRRHLLAGTGHPYLVLRFSTGDPAATAAPRTPRLSSDQLIERS